MTYPTDISRDAKRIAALLRDKLNTTLSVDDSAVNWVEQFERIYAYHANRIPYTEDFGQILLFELQADNLIGNEISVRQLNRVLTRIRKRVRDELKRDSRIASRSTEQAQAPATTDLWADLVDKLDPLETRLLEVIAGSRSVEDFTAEFAMSRASYYRARGELLEKLRLRLGEYND